MFCRTVLACVLVLASTLLIAPATSSTVDPPFGSLDNQVNWTISTGAGLTITMHKPTCDITSILFHDQQLQISSNGTYVNSGLQWNGAVTSHIANFTDGGKKMIQITCDLKGLTQYFFFRAMENNIYMGTYHTPALFIPELRMLALLSVDTMGGAPRPAIMWDGLPIEFSDICMIGNETRSKYYSAIPFIDDDMHHVWGKAGALYAVQPQQVYETAVGGPFFRDININLRDYRNELTFYMNSNHTRTEQYRYGFHGPYAFAFTDGGKPTGLDYAFFQRRHLTGFVKDTERGRVAGTISDPRRVLHGWGDVVVHFFNKDAQYWTKAKHSVLANTYQYSTPLMIPGVYTTIVYRKEMPVATASVTVTKGKINSASNIAVSYVETKPLWRIGEWDGTPDGFLNADKIYWMHPSDLRMAPWTALTFEIGMSKDEEFPLAQFRGINDPITIQFSLQADAKPSKLRIGITVEYLKPRLVVTVNDWAAPIQASFCVDDEINVCATGRSITRGVTHGNYGVYEYDIPSSAFKVGSNNITLSIISNEADTGPWARPSVAFDALELL